MRHILFLVAVAALMAQPREKRIVPVSADLRQSFERQPRVAVLAGVGVYPSRSGLSRLRFPSHDVELLEAELSKQGYKVVALKEQEATRGSVEQALKDAAELVDRGQGTVLFFFSGHGFSDKGENYLATFEATSGDLAGSGLAVKKVEAMLKATGAPRQVMFIDACRNDPGKGVGARSFEGFQASAGLRELLSTKAGRISYEDDQLGSGVFTHFLVKGLEGGAAGQDGLITFRDLADYVTEGVSTFGFQHGQMQVPYEAGESSGDFLLAAAPRPAASPPLPSLPAAITTTIETVSNRAAEVKVNSKDLQKYVWVSPGTFLMGCSSGDGECSDDEKPPHQVTITKGFWIGQTEVLQKAYEKVTGVNPSYQHGDSLPVDSVSWNDAQAYCRVAGLRLPTEAEWEYAARGGTSGPRYGALDDIAWHQGNASNRVHEGGQKQPNRYGLYDMLGNAWEWVADWHDEKYYRSSSATDPQGPPGGQFRAVRGGSWDNVPAKLRVSYRNAADQGYRSPHVGFRCAGSESPK